MAPMAPGRVAPVAWLPPRIIPWSSSPAPPAALARRWPCAFIARAIAWPWWRAERPRSKPGPAPQESPPSHEIYRADVAVAERIIAAGQDCIARQGLPDVVIANAGISVGMDTAER